MTRIASIALFAAAALLFAAAPAFAQTMTLKAAPTGPAGVKPTAVKPTPVKTAPARPTLAKPTTGTTTGTTTGATTPTTTTTAAPMSGNYRVTITGFTANHETWDNAFELDGKRDEVWIDAEVSILDRNNNSILPGQPLRSKVMGDVNNQPGRIQAGTASSLGGIRSYDNVPSATPWVMSGTAQPDRLPLAVWEGQLVQGQSAVVITPSIWEWDGPQDVVSAYFSWWKDVINNGMKTAQQTAFVQSVFGTPTRYALDLQQTQFRAVTGFVEDVFGKAEDRPIGLDVSGTGPDGRPIYAPKLKMITLTYESAETLLKQNVNGRGYGVLAIPYVDNAKFAGNYTLFVKLEKI